MGLGDIVEGEDRHTQACEEIASEDNKRVEWELGDFGLILLPSTDSTIGGVSRAGRQSGTYNWDNFSLDSLIQGDEPKEKRQVELIDCQ